MEIIWGCEISWKCLHTPYDQLMITFSHGAEFSHVLEFLYITTLKLHLESIFSNKGSSYVIYNYVIVYT